jgi:hypothetical protein
MGYSTVKSVEQLLPNSVMSETPATLDRVGDLISVGTQRDDNLIPNELINSYLTDAAHTIDASLNQIYRTPLKKKSDLELSLLGSVDSVAGSDEVVTGKVLRVSGNLSLLNVGDTLVILQNSVREDIEVASVSGEFVTLNANLIGTFRPDARIVRVDYPQQIKFISSRLAAANVYDKFFTAQADKQESKYGDFLREAAIIELNKILAGVNILHGQLRIGNLTVNPNLLKRYTNPESWNEKPFEIKKPGSNS